MNIIYRHLEGGRDYIFRFLSEIFNEASYTITQILFFEILLASTQKTKLSAVITLVQKAYKITAI